MRRCPFCANTILDEDIKCIHCGKYLDEKTQDKWYFKTSFIVIAFLCVGPLALPLVWFNPRFSVKAKIILSALFIIITYFLGVMFMQSLKNLEKYYKLAF